jgi:hypothetical protein
MRVTELRKQEWEEQKKRARNAASQQATVIRKGSTREQLDRQLHEIARANGGSPNVRIVPGEGIVAAEITARVLGYTLEREEMLVERRLGDDLVRIQWGGKEPLEIGKTVNINPRNGEIDHGLGRG